mgnify:CR=1 FL=1
MPLLSEIQPNQLEDKQSESKEIPYSKALKGWIEFLYN